MCKIAMESKVFSITLCLFILSIQYGFAEEASDDMITSTSLLQLKEKFPIKFSGLFTLYGKGMKESCNKNDMLIASVENTELVLYAIEEVNNHPDLLPGIELSLHIKADCYADVMALDEILKIFQKCEADEKEITTDRERYWGLIGPSTSLVSVPVGKLLGLFDFPMISCLATSSVLSDKQRFPTFFRTVPSDVHQVTAIIDLLLRKNWLYVSFLYEDDDYGISAFDAFTQQIRNTSICLARQHKIRKNANDDDMFEVVNSLKAEHNSRVVIAFIFEGTIIDLFREVDRQNQAGRFQWIGSDSWLALLRNNCSNQEYEPDNSFFLDAILNSAIVFQLHLSTHNKFESYLKRRTIVDAQKNNPFFAAYIAKRNNCSLEPNSTNICHENLTLPHHVTQSGSIQSFSQACVNTVYAYAIALDNARRNICFDSSVLCDEFKRMNSSLLVSYLQDVYFLDRDNLSFSFDEEHNGPVWYDIFWYKNSTRCWNYLGDFRTNLNFAEGTEFLQNEEVKSRCSAPCGKNQYQIIHSEKHCCWHCGECGPNQGLKSSFVPSVGSSSADACFSCSNFTYPSGNQCLPLDERYLSFKNALVWPVVVTSSLGILLTFFTATVYGMFWNTPLIRASGRELCSLILVGIFSTFAVPFLFCFKPNDFICAARRFCIGFSFTLVFAGLLVKTVRISLVFNHLGKHLVRDYKLILRPTPQIVTALLLTVVEVFILIIWFLHVKPSIVIKAPPKHIAFEDRYTAVDCEGLDSVSVLVGLIYPFFLILICTFFAIKIRKVPSGFNEAKCIGFAVYATIVIWMAQLSTYFVQITSHIELRDTIYCLCLSLNALIILLAIFGPKVYIAVLRPEKNNQTVVMSLQRPSLSNITVISPEKKDKVKENEKITSTRRPSIASSIKSRRELHSIKTDALPKTNVKPQALPEIYVEADQEQSFSSRSQQDDKKNSNEPTSGQESFSDDLEKNYTVNSDSKNEVWTSKTRVLSDSELKNNKSSLMIYSSPTKFQSRYRGTINQSYDD